MYIIIFNNAMRNYSSVVFGAIVKIAPKVCYCFMIRLPTVPSDVLTNKV